MHELVIPINFSLSLQAVHTENEARDYVCGAGYRGLKLLKKETECKLYWSPATIRQHKRSEINRGNVGEVSKNYLGTMIVNGFQASDLSTFRFVCPSLALFMTTLELTRFPILNRSHQMAGTGIL